MSNKKPELESAEEMKRRQQALQRRQQRNRQSALTLETTMFDQRSRYLMLSLTFTYKEAWRPFITLDDIRRDRNALLNNIPFNNLLKGINGYVWKLEEGSNGGGIHMHMVIFYDGRHQRDIYFAEQIKNYWENVITGGRGLCDNGNISKHKYSEAWGNFTGQLDASNETQRACLQNYLRHYMTKTSQEVISRDNPHTKLFGVGYGRRSR